MARRETRLKGDISRFNGRNFSKSFDMKAYAKRTRYGVHFGGSQGSKSNGAKSNGAKSIKSRIAGATKTYLGNSGRHSLEKGNKLASHNKVYRQIRKSFGMSAG